VWILYKFCFYPRYPKKILGFSLQGVVWVKLPALQNSLSNHAANKILNSDEIEKNITDPKHFESIRPMADEQIENFLRHKLKEVFPMIGMFIGDKTINQLKEVFMAELQTLFPAAIKMYATHLIEDLDIENMISKKISDQLVNSIIPDLKKNVWHQLKNLAIATAIFGFFIGLFEVVLFICLQ
jgi:uncharacterized membrane protein YheB (UPF0754 family)